MSVPLIGCDILQLHIDLLISALMLSRFMTDMSTLVVNQRGADILVPPVPVKPKWKWKSSSCRMYSQALFVCVCVCVFGVWAVSTRGYSAIYNWHWQSCMRTLCCMRRTEREQENTMNCSLHSYIKCPHSVNSQHLCLYSVLYLISPRWQRLALCFKWESFWRHRVNVAPQMLSLLELLYTTAPPANSLPHASILRLQKLSTDKPTEIFCAETWLKFTTFR